MGEMHKESDDALIFPNHCRSCVKYITYIQNVPSGYVRPTTCSPWRGIYMNTYTILHITSSEYTIYKYIQNVCSGYVNTDYLFSMTEDDADREQELLYRSQLQEVDLN